VNVGKSIAAFERTFVPLENRFDRYIDTIWSRQPPSKGPTLTLQEINGFKVFASKGQCTRCHNGLRLTDDFLHNTGLADVTNPYNDRGRATAFAQLDADLFTSVGRFSNAKPKSCGDLRFMAREFHLFDRAFKSPSLRGVAERAPFMHAGQIATLAQVIEHYNSAFPALPWQSEIVPLGLSTREKAALLAFLQTL
jgi:cytochrome c peroxidase